MSERETSDPYVPYIVHSATSDMVALAGIEAICRLLIEKGIFDEKDIGRVVRPMRDAVPSATEPTAYLVDKQLQWLTDMKMNLLNKQSDISGRPAQS